MTTRTTAELADALEARATVHEELAVAARLDAVAFEHENDAALLRAAASRLRELESALEDDETSVRDLALALASRDAPDGTTEGDTLLDIYARRALQHIRARRALGGER